METEGDAAWGIAGMLKDFSVETARGIFGCAVVWLVVNLESKKFLALGKPQQKGGRRRL